MKPLAAIGIGVAGLWLASPTYDQFYLPWPFAVELVVLGIGAALIIGGVWFGAKRLGR